MPPGARRSKIRPPRKSLINSSSTSSTENSTTDTTIDFDKNWLILANAISQIQNKNVSNLSYEQLYRKAYMLVLRKFGGKLYDNVTEAIKNHLLIRREYLITLSANPEMFMPALIQEWNDHLQSMKFISDVLMYLNRVYVKEHKKLLVYDLGILLFKDHVIKCNDHEIGFKVIDIVINEVTKSRLGNVITSTMYITKIINMMELLIESSGSFYGDSYYQIYFEPKFLQNSEESFQTLSTEYVSYNLGTKYLQLTTLFIKDEENRVRFYLPPSTYPKLIELMNNIMIKDKIDRMILSPNQGLTYWLKPVVSNIFETTNTETYHYADLKLLYNLVGRYDNDEYQLLRLRIKEAIITQGNSLPEYVRASIDNPNNNNNNKKPVAMNSSTFAIKWIETVLKFRDQLLLVWKNSFDLNLMIEQTITFALRDFINGNDKRGQVKKVNAPELLSVYMDYYIKQLTKSGTSSILKSGDPTEELINTSIQFLKYIKNKDAFEVYYANHFAKRFLNSKTSTKDTEEIILGSLSEELGVSSFDKVIKMNRDVITSQQINQDWKNYIRKKQDFIDIDLKICSVTDWPKAMTKNSKEKDEISLKWPSSLEGAKIEFEEFYERKNSNRKLYWSTFGGILLKASLPTGTFIIDAGIIAGSILLTFNDNEELKYEEIKSLVGGDESELKRHLKSLLISKLLISKNEIFRLNDKVKFKTRVVKIKTIKKNDNEQEEEEEIKEDVRRIAKIRIEASIVRIMKSYKNCNFKDLVEELFKQITRFNPQISMIKECIEDLIDKEYLKRDLEDHQLYHYIA